MLTTGIGLGKREGDKHFQEKDVEEQAIGFVVWHTTNCTSEIQLPNENPIAIDDGIPENDERLSALPPAGREHQLKSACFASGRLPDVSIN